MTNLIGISGKIGSGKDTIGKIIQYLVYENSNPEYPFDKDINEYLSSNSFLFTPKGMRGFVNMGAESKWEIKKFADKLKDIVCLLIGCTREQLEDADFKNNPLGEEWIRYGYADGFKHIYEDGVKTTVMINKECSKERYEEEFRINWQTAYKNELTPRQLLQFIGTNLFRDKILQNIWVNSLFADYKDTTISKGILKKRPIYPNWIITDVRFKNEVEAIKKRNGIVIRVNRYDYIFKDGKRIIPNKEYVNINENQHESETALDSYTDWDYTIDNSGSIEDLIKQVERILKAEFII